MNLERIAEIEAAFGEETLMDYTWAGSKVKIVRVKP